jgi:hypothetical protein
LENGGDVFMTTCSTEQCGVMGTGSGTRPGDPDGNSILTASPAFGGIDVTWSLPTTNPHAVAYTILYRGILPDFNSAIVIANAGGNFFYDKSTNETSLTYYYWVRLVSINGTVGELIGPASAAARPPIADVITGLTGKIDVGTLATSLRNEIDKVEFYHDIFLNERSVRVAADIQFGSLLAQYSADLDQLQFYLGNEIIARQIGQDNLLGSVNTVALASEQNIAAVQTTLQTNISSVDGKVTAIGALYTAKVSVNGLIGGFGIFNDGTEVEAGFDVDRFWIGRTQTNKRKPFIIQNGEVFIDQAVINQLTFTKLRDEAGSVMVEDGKLKADYITVKEIRSEDGKFVIDAVNKTITIEV